MMKKSKNLLSYLWFILYVVCVLITVALVVVCVNHFAGLVFHFNIMELYLNQRCGSSSIVCETYKFTFQVINSPYWIIIFLPIAGAIIGSRKIENRNKVI